MTNRPVLTPGALKALVDALRYKPDTKFWGEPVAVDEYGISSTYAPRVLPGGTTPWRFVSFDGSEWGAVDMTPYSYGGTLTEGDDESPAGWEVKVQTTVNRHFVPTEITFTHREHGTHIITLVRGHSDEDEGVDKKATPAAEVERILKALSELLPPDLVAFILACEQAAS